MRVIEALMVRDEADIVGSQIEYHLAAGVDFVIAIDHESHDGTSEILDSFARRGRLHRIPVRGPVDEVGWRTLMARLAATEYGADWILSADADEFWVPRRGTIKEVLSAVPERFGIVGGVICHFVPRPDTGAPFFDRMTARLVQVAPVNDPTSPMRPSPKAAFRADPDVHVLHAAYWLESSRLVPLRGWYPFDVFHFPCRSVEQWARKTGRRGHAESDKPLGQYVRGFQAQREGRIEDVYEALVVDDAALEKGIALGLITVDSRLRDSLSSRGHTVARDLAVPVDAISLDDSTLVRLQRRVDDAGSRASALEARSGRKIGLRRSRRGDSRSVLR